MPDKQPFNDEVMYLVKGAVNKLYRPNRLFEKEDVLQNAYLHVCTVLHLFDPSRSKLSTFIYMAVFRHFNKWKKKQVKHSHEYLPEGLISPHRDKYLTEVRLDVETLLTQSGLSMLERNVLKMHYLQDKSHGEISTLTGVSEKYISTVKMRALEHVWAYGERNTLRQHLH